MKTASQVIKIVLVLYSLLCVLLYFIQEKLIFFPQKLPADYQFSFDQPFREMHFATADKQQLTGLLFKAEKPKGLIFYLHGNAGDLSSWGAIAKTYTNLQYDLFMLDYRGYGKSSGTIQGEKQFYEDVELVYSQLLKAYDEKKVVILGYSIGTGAATRLASVNHPRLLILQAPYYNLTDLVKKNFRIVPPFLLKYKFATNEMLPARTMPVIIFHGDRDEVIYYGSSLKLSTLFKPADTLITLHGQGHNGMSDNPDYQQQLATLLAQ